MESIISGKLFLLSPILVTTFGQEKFNSNPSISVSFSFITASIILSASPIFVILAMTGISSSFSFTHFARVKPYSTETMLGSVGP